MNRLLILWALAFAVGMCQSPRAQVRVGPKLGPVSTTVEVTNSLADRYPRRAGTSVGVVVEVPVRGALSVQVEPSLVPRGSDVEFGPDFGYLRASTRLRYLSLPVLAKASAPIGRVSPYAMAGPALSLVVSEAFTFNDEAPTASDDLARDVDVTVEAETGVEVRLRRSTALSLGVRYSRGLTDISLTDAGTVHTEGVSVLPGLLVRL